MISDKTVFNRLLFAILVALYLLTLGAFSYANWAADPEFTTWWKTLANVPILSIPLVLLYGSIYLLTVAWRQHTKGGQVNPRLARLIRWAPRIAAIAIIFFISLFSLDVFGMQGSLLQKLGGFLVHNIPSIVMIVLLILAWKRPMIGFVAFTLAGLGFALAFARGDFMLSNLVMFVLPILLVAGLFYADWRWVGKPGGL